MNVKDYFKQLENRLIITKKASLLNQEIIGLTEDYIGPANGNHLKDLNQYKPIK